MLLELYECRLVMEPYAVRIALPFYSQEDIATLQDLAGKSAECFYQEDFDHVIRLNTAFHDRLISACQNIRLKKTIQKYQELSFLARQQEFNLLHRDVGFIPEHENIVRAIEHGDANMVEVTMRSHLQNDLNFYYKNIQK